MKNPSSLYYRYVNKYPADIEFFKMFQGLSAEELRSSAQMRADAEIYMTAMTSFVDNLDDKDCFDYLAKKVASSHYKMGIRLQQFKVSVSRTFS